jgi:hypothetical protein
LAVISLRVYPCRVRNQAVHDACFFFRNDFLTVSIQQKLQYFLENKLKYKMKSESANKDAFYLFRSL